MDSSNPDNLCNFRIRSRSIVIFIFYVYDTIFHWCLIAHIDEEKKRWSEGGKIASTLLFPMLRPDFFFISRSSET